jgi:hypothetical protein
MDDVLLESLLALDTQTKRGIAGGLGRNQTLTKGEEKRTEAQHSTTLL